MKITSKKLKNSSFLLTVELDEKEFAKYETQALKKFSGSMKVSGFRKGHVPESVIRKEVGEAGILQEAMDLALPQAYSKVLIQEKLNPLDQPQVEIKGMKPFSFEATVQVYPEVKLKKMDYSKVKIKTVKVSKKEIKEQVDMLRENMAEKKSVTRKCKKGDTVVIDFNGKNKEGVEQEGMKSEGHPLEIGSAQFIPGFEEEVLGMKKEEEKTFEITFPKDYHAAQYAGVTVDFTVTAQDVLEKTLPKVDDAFAQKLTGDDKKTVAGLEEEIEGHIKKQAEDKNFADAQRELFELIGKNTSAELPDIFVDSEVDGIIDNIKMQGLQGGMPWEKHLENIKKTEDELKKDVRKDAEKAILSQLGLQKAMDEEKISVTAAQVQTEMDAELAQTPQADRKKKEHDMQHHGGVAKIENRLKIRQFFEKKLG